MSHVFLYFIMNPLRFIVRIFATFILKFLVLERLKRIIKIDL